MHCEINDFKFKEHFKSFHNHACNQNPTCRIICIYKPKCLWPVFSTSSVFTFDWFKGRKCNETDVRLVGNRNSHEGRVEVCEGGVWSRVCGTAWDQNDATVVCRQLGYNGR